MNQQICNKKPVFTGIFTEPMTCDESFKYIENLETHKFSYEEWEITRDLNLIPEYEELIKKCDPRISF